MPLGQAWQALDARISRSASAMCFKEHLGSFHVAPEDWLHRVAPRRFIGAKFGNHG